MKATRKRLQLEKLLHSLRENSLEVSGFVLEIFNSYWKLLVHTAPQQENFSRLHNIFIACSATTTNHHWSQLPQGSQLTRVGSWRTWLSALSSALKWKIAINHFWYRKETTTCKVCANYMMILLIFAYIHLFWLCCTSQSLAEWPGSFVGTYPNSIRGLSSNKTRPD